MHCLLPKCKYMEPDLIHLLMPCSHHMLLNTHADLPGSFLTRLPSPTAPSPRLFHVLIICYSVLQFLIDFLFHEKQREGGRNLYS